MALPGTLLLWWCCFAWLCSISYGSQGSQGEAEITGSVELEPEAEPWSLLQPFDSRDPSGLLPPLFKVLSDERDGPPRLQPDSRALRYMKRLYKAYATKEGIPKSTRSHLYNTVRLFTPGAQHKQTPENQVTGILSVELLFHLDSVTAPEHLLKSVLRYTFNDWASLPAAAHCTGSLEVGEAGSSGKTTTGAPDAFPFSSRFEFRKKRQWIEMDVTPLLQPLVASNKRNIRMSVTVVCEEGRPRRPRAGPFNTSPLVPPSLLLFLNDTSAQAYHRCVSLHSQSSPAQRPERERGLAACPMGTEAAECGPTAHPHPRHRRGQGTVGSKVQGPLVPASLNLSEYFKQFLFPQNECELHDFRLSFSQLKWDNWIVAPHRYNPRFCKGECPRAVGHRYGSPVHTMVQNVIHEKLDSSVPRPACVPANYSPLSVLTIEPDGSIAYKEYEDMIATKCTCR
ncbi:growth/differentiation factor 9 [Echinops telfairi]|uniref:Growth/differentiation factor 9 n=1 Tax=Echinops telfairi TaxID=9371 RepID=A0ABM0IBY6_ECHTE|nr:growth/differentiation factor 9 [Echinops telfairi]